MCLCSNHSQRKIDYQLETERVWEGWEGEHLGGAGGRKGKGESDAILLQLKT